VKLIQRTVGYSEWDPTRSEDTIDRVKIKQMVDCIQNYLRKWKEHMNRMNTRRIRKILCSTGWKSIKYPM